MLNKVLLGGVTMGRTVGTGTLLSWFCVGAYGGFAFEGKRVLIEKA